VTDSSCDLPQQLVEELGITVVPLVVVLGDQAYEDGAVSLDEFWQRVKVGEQPKTSQPPVGVFEQVYERIVDQGFQAICVTITSKHSGTYNSAQVAAERFGDQVAVFDSLSLALGLGFQVLAAAEAAQTGKPLPEILALLASLRERTQVTIVLNTLESLRRGGRADTFIAVADRMARALDVKPIINVVDGQLRLLTAARSYNGAIARALKLVEQIGSLEQVGVVHTRSDEVAQRVADQLGRRIGFPREQIAVSEIGPAIATHAGPGAIGIATVATA
jgi:DegV family protein with EDD domain